MDFLRKAIVQDTVAMTLLLGTAMMLFLLAVMLAFFK